MTALLSFSNANRPLYQNQSGSQYPEERRCNAESRCSASLPSNVPATTWRSRSSTSKFSTFQIHRRRELRISEEPEIGEYSMVWAYPYDMHSDLERSADLTQKSGSCALKISNGAVTWPAMRPACGLVAVQENMQRNVPFTPARLVRLQYGHRYWDRD